MKRWIISSEEVNKNFEYNARQTQVGSPLKTYKGSPIKRCPKYGVGKEIGGQIYFHKDYADKIVPPEILEACEEALDYYYSDLYYNCMRWDPKKLEISFQEAPDFDTAREPVVGDYVNVIYDPNKDPKDFKMKKGHSNYIWHHKWIFVDNNYTGFDVEDSWNWSKRWLSTLTETSDGNGIERWNAQLDRYGLPHDE